MTTDKVKRMICGHPEIFVDYLWEDELTICAICGEVLEVRVNEDSLNDSLEKRDGTMKHNEKDI